MGKAALKRRWRQAALELDGPERTLLKLSDSQSQYSRFLQLADNPSTSPLTVKTSATDMLKTFEYVYGKMLRPFYESQIQDGKFSPSLLDEMSSNITRPTILAYRASACLALGEFREAKGDADKALEIFGLPGHEGDRTTQTLRAQALYARGDSLNGTGELKEAFGDLLKACEIERNVLNRGCDTVIAMDSFFEVMAKMNRDKKRPHYDETEMEEICKKLCIGDYAPEKKKCYYCGYGCRDMLKRCGKCGVAWYCCKACQRADWLGGHKTKCRVMKKEKETSRATLLANDQKEVILEELDAQGFSLLYTDDSPGVLLRDKDTGQLFESLNNQDAVFEEEVDEWAKQTGSSVIYA